MPQRIQRKRTKGWRMPPNTVSVTRPGKYGNPFKIGDKMDDECVPNGYIIIGESDCLEFFENYVNCMLMDDPHWLDPLKGKDLACFCPLTNRCHADVLLRLANEQSPTPPPSFFAPSPYGDGCLPRPLSTAIIPACVSSAVAAHGISLHCTFSARSAGRNSPCSTCSALRSLWPSSFSCPVLSGRISRRVRLPQKTP